MVSTPLHRRAQIRHAAAADLAGLPTTGANVYAGRRFRLGTLDLPALLVYGDGETSEAATMVQGGAMGAAPGRIYDRDLALVIHGVVSAPDPEESGERPEEALDDLFDQIAREVEARLYAAFEGGFASQLSALGVSGYELQETEFSVEQEGARLLGSVALTWSVRYSASEHDPSEES